MTTKGSIIADVATAHVGASATKLTALYDDVVVRPVDRIGRMHKFYYSDRLLSTCGLFVLGCWRLAGVDEPETTASYDPPGGPERDAFVDEENLAMRYGAWVRPTPGHAPDIREGDAWIITDAAGGDGHTGIATSDFDPHSGIVATVEGGQGDVMGSTGTGAFSRLLVPDQAGRWMMGHRYLYGWIRAELLPVPLPAPAETGPDTHRDQVDPDATIEPVG